MSDSGLPHCGLLWEPTARHLHRNAKAPLIGRGQVLDPDQPLPGRSRSPLPPPLLTAPSLMNWTPAASSTPIIFISVSITPRTPPLLASMRWIVGNETPNARLASSAPCPPARRRPSFALRSARLSVRLRVTARHDRRIIATRSYFGRCLCAKIKIAGSSITLGAFEAIHSLPSRRSRPSRIVTGCGGHPGT